MKPGIRSARNTERHVPDGAQIEIANLFRNLMDDWKLSEKDLAILLGLDNDDPGRKYVESLLAEECSFSGHDIRDRMAQLIEIREILFALFRNHELENVWLRGKQETLDNKAPMDLLLEGSRGNFVRALGFIKTVAGR